MALVWNWPYSLDWCYKTCEVNGLWKKSPLKIVCKYIFKKCISWYNFARFFSVFSWKMHQQSKINEVLFRIFRFIFCCCPFLVLYICSRGTMWIHEKCTAARLHVLIALLKHLHNNDVNSFGRRSWINKYNSVEKKFAQFPLCSNCGHEHEQKLNVLL